MIRTRKRILPLLFVVAMIVSLFSGLSISAAATDAPSSTDYWTSSSTYYNTSWYTGHENDTTYTLSNAADLAGLAVLVNNGTTTFDGKIVNLAAGGNFDLGAHYWYPIGGVAALSSGVPGGTYFAGTFNGANAEIKNLYVTYISGNSGYGFFGSVKGGHLVNVTLKSGSVDVGSNSVSCIGALAGYCTGNVYNCHNEGVTVSMTNTSASMCGGLVGTEENNTTSAIYVQYCSNKADVTGRGRVGGIVGAAYCTVAGGVVIDDCYNTGDLTTVGSSTKSYLGGIVGYCRGYITNCYSICSDIETNGGHYQAGIAGLIQGSGPMGGISNCYAMSKFGSNANASYDRYLFGTLDNSTTMTVSNCLFVDTHNLASTSTYYTAAAITQPMGTASARWGYWTNVGYFYDSTSEYASTSGTQVYTTGNSGYVSGNTPTDVLNEDTSLIAAGSTSVIPTNKFSASSNKNDGYPYLNWETGSVPEYNYDGTSILAGSYEVFVSGSGSDSTGNGTESAPYYTLNKALSKCLSTGTIKVSGTVTIDSDVTSYSSINITRYGNFTGEMFNVTGGTSIISTASIYGGGETIFKVDSGSLELCGNVSLSTTGTAVDLNDGTLLVEGASFKLGSTSITVARGATFNLNPVSTTSIYGNVYLENTNTTDTYITLGNTLTTVLSVKCANDATGTQVIRGEYDVLNGSLTNMRYDGSTSRISSDIDESFDLDYFAIKLT